MAYLRNADALLREGYILSALHDLQGEAEGVLVLRQNVLRASLRSKRLALLRHDHLQVGHVYRLDDLTTSPRALSATWVKTGRSRIPRSFGLEG